MEESGPYRLTTPGDAHWAPLVPWIVVVPLVVVCAYILSSSSMGALRIVPAVGVILTIGVVCLPAIISFTPGVRAWTLRTAVVSEDGLVVDMPGKEPFAMAWSDISRVWTHPITLMQVPGTDQLITEFFRIDGRRIPELTIHHSSYQHILRTVDLNPDGPALLRALEESPLDLGAASRALADLVHTTVAGGLEGLSPRTADAARDGRVWHARRYAKADEEVNGRVPEALVRIDLVLARRPVVTARRALGQRPKDAFMRYSLAHALLADIGVSKKPSPAVLAHRSAVRKQARELLEGLAGDAVYGEIVARELKALWPNT
ncbi:MAG: hypothetical protein Q7W16_01840 [Coriobacteriia bacterium]|nr:hypothetical protein [Coriobacteriia bacterium]